uniref:Putative ixostatin n=1 Tax=Ixodes ricinus TaxID=34613 RepID=A0A0K8RJ90_IXORI
MNKATFFLLVTSQLFYHAASEHKNWTDGEKTFGVKECWEILRKRLNESCIEKGANGVATVDFAACKMGCANNPEKGSAHVIQDMPNGTPCGLYNETCQTGTCKGECFIPTETIEDIETE